ncbi:carbohydrate kinase family protein [Microbacterium sp. RG1]|uniref:carbohydrate kinase family protein n=1 Tax=Microbacterium sp. RG1 TaxID=2489212 RepID=UPI0010CA43BE|nr:carbohydrate kinase [Microbacterium sp. RG1]QCQ17545.1 carbohydrate kinase [Microbacterium sp. RG1]
MSGEVLVVGESVIDIVRSPERDETEVVGGSPANVALGLARQGVSVDFHTALARDARGERIAAHLAAAGVDVAEASWSLPVTSSALAEIGSDGAARYTFDVSWHLPVPPRSTSASVVHVGSVAAFLEPGASTVERALEGRGADVAVTFDPNIREALVPDHASALARFERLAAMSDVVKLSDEDAEWLYPGAGEESVARRLLVMGPRLVAVTRGGAGALIAGGDIMRSIVAPAVTVRDTVGAGDTFMAALIAQLLWHPQLLAAPTTELLDAVGRYTVTAAAITVQRVGADLPTAAEIGSALDGAVRQDGP